MIGKRSRDRLSWMRCLGFDLGGAMPDENIIRHNRDWLIENGALEALITAIEQCRCRMYSPQKCQTKIPQFEVSANSLRG